MSWLTYRELEAARDAALAREAKALDALVLAAQFVEPMRITDAERPYRELAPELREVLYAASEAIRSVLPEPEGEP
jgi:hypothetical protein